MAEKTNPIVVREGSVTITLYKTKHATSASGFNYRFRWVDPATGEDHWGSGVNLERAKAKARTQARQLSLGITQAQRITAADVQELAAARGIVAKTSVPITIALQEWVAAREIAGPAILEACRAWKTSRPTVKRILLGEAISKFIAAKVAAKRKLKTYGPKLAQVLNGLGNVHLDTLTTAAIQKWYNGIPDGTTANDRLKRLVTLLHWSRRQGYLNRLQPLPTDDLDRRTDSPAEIGIIDAAALKDILEFFRASHPQYLAAVALAAFCGLRSDEIHGKRTDKGVSRTKVPRQRWSDIKLTSENPHLNVTIAKTGTPSWRLVPICPAGVKWLNLSRAKFPSDEYVCIAGAMERVRELYRARLRQRFEDQGVTGAELAERIDHGLPENAFRHSRITYRIAELNGNKHQVAEESGNSVAIINRRYRRPAERSDALAWFAVSP